MDLIMRMIDNLAWRYEDIVGGQSDGVWWSLRIWARKYLKISDL